METMVHETGFIKLCKARFQQLSWLHPKATQSMSKEIYFINKGWV
jgi:23S rRNA U2552 (ribose-2'-O)-methylase RlmE/FtsJ